MKYAFDIDETICFSPKDEGGHTLYFHAQPYPHIIKSINDLYEDGHEIIIATSRGGTSGDDWTEVTKGQLKRWGVNYHKLIMDKFSYDYFIDDKAANIEDWKKQKNIKKTVGLVASAFDLFHAGHCLMVKDAKRICDYLVACLHVDPSLERPEKNKPLQSLQERKIQLESCKYIDKIIEYGTEKDLEVICQFLNPDIRILGSDCKTRTFVTGGKECGALYYHERNHDYSSSGLRKKINEQ